MVNVIASGSKGNAVLYNNEILVDCGVPYSVIKPYVDRLKLVFLTHSHKDHLNIKTLQKLHKERPTLRFACGEFLLDKMEGISTDKIDIMCAMDVYDYGYFKISPITLYHDVTNFGARLFIGDIKIFHATDSAHLKGITAKNYDYYCIEHNYPEEETKALIQRKMQAGEFCHQIGSINSHLSVEQAQEFYLANKGEHSQLIRLHETRTIY